MNIFFSLFFVFLFASSFQVEAESDCEHLLNDATNTGLIAAVLGAEKGSVPILHALRMVNDFACRHKWSSCRQGDTLDQWLQGMEQTGIPGAKQEFVNALAMIGDDVKHCLHLWI